MRAPATPFFRDVSFRHAARDHAAHERFLLDTMVERRAEEKPRARFPAIRAFVSRARAFR